MKEIQVSIIIATYNSEKTIRKAMDSVISQTFQEWECIVVDGLSKDKTIDIVNEYVKNDSRIRYISEKDNGIYDAFNKGWKLARGKWIHYLGSDDWLTKESFTNLLKEPIKNNVAIISGNCYCVKSPTIITPNISVQFNGCHQGKITRRSVIERLGGFDESYPILADSELIFKIKYSNYEVINVDSFVAYFSMNGVSQKISSIIKISKERIRLYKNYPKAQKHPYFITIKLAIKNLISNLKNQKNG